LRGAGREGLPLLMRYGMGFLKSLYSNQRKKSHVARGSFKRTPFADSGYEKVAKSIGRGSRLTGLYRHSSSRPRRTRRTQKSAIGMTNGKKKKNRQNWKRGLEN